MDTSEKQAQSPPRRKAVQHYTCVECGEPATMGSGRLKRVCKACVPDPRARNRYFKFKMTEPQYRRLFLKQEGKCGICQKGLTHNKTKGSKNYACIDHCHRTNKVRGLLCPACNTRLSGVEDINWLPKAVLWLKEKE